MVQTIETFAEIADSSFSGQALSPAVSKLEHGRQQALVVRRALMGLGFSALWGLAAAAAHPLLALNNIYKVPMVLALSAVVALPAVFVTGRLLELTVKPLAIAAAMVTSFYRATMLLVGFAPLLGVYAYTTQSIAPVLAQVSAFLALGTGALVLRSELGQLTAPKAHVSLLGLVAVVTTVLALWQLISLATPVLTLPTVFGGGIDGVLR